MTSYGQYDVIMRNIVHNWAEFARNFGEVATCSQDKYHVLRAVPKYSLKDRRKPNLFINGQFDFLIIVEITELPFSYCTKFAT